MVALLVLCIVFFLAGCALVHFASKTTKTRLTNRDVNDNFERYNNSLRIPEN